MTFQDVMTCKMSSKDTQKQWAQIVRAATHNASSCSWLSILDGPLMLWVNWTIQLIQFIQKVKNFTKATSD